MRYAAIFRIVIALQVGLAAQVFAQQPKAGPSQEIEILQRRLTDAGCYGGPVDGKLSEDLDRARKSCPSQNPQLRIETGMHVAPIKSIAVDARCSLAVTGSRDKTIRVWSLPDGRLRRTIRPPIAEGTAGAIYAVALSPDGRWIAAGGWSVEWGISRTDYVTMYGVDGAPPRRLGPLPQSVHRIAFSPDGRRLAAGLGRKGVRIFDVASGNQIFADDQPSQDTTTGLAYSQDGTLYTVAEDGMLRVYGADLVRKNMVKAPSKDPFSIALSPDDTRLAVGYYENSRVDIFATKDMTLLATADASGGVGDLSTITWTRNGSLYGTGDFSVPPGKDSLIRRWNGSGRRQGEDRRLARDSVTSLVPCGSDLAFSSSEPSFGLIGPSGQARYLGVSAAADMRNKLRSLFQISADARQVYFGLDYDAKRGVLFDLTEAKLSEANKPPAGLIMARTDGMPVADWEDNSAPTYAGRKLSMLSNDVSRSLAIRSDKSGFFLGAEFSLRAYDGKGIAKRPPIRLPGGVWGMVLTADDKILVIASADGTIRWYRAEDLTELLALFIDTRDRRWVAWTPSGYYMASAGGENLIGWHINRGTGQEAEFYPASQFHDRYYRPDIVQLVLTTLDENAALKRAEAERIRQSVTTPLTPLPPLIAILPPQVTIVSPKDGALFSDQTVDIAYHVRASAGQTIDLVQALVNGRVVSSQKGKIIDQSEGTFALPLPKQNVLVEVKAASGSLVGQGASVKLAFEGPSPPQPARPDLYVLAIGVDDYLNSHEFPKTYADVDVTDLTAALKKQAGEGRMFAHVFVKSLVGDQASLSNLRGAFDELNQAKDNDYVIIYTAGHGYVGADLKYRFMLRSADLGRLNASSLTARDLLEPLSAVRGKKLMLIESCHAGIAMPAVGRRSGYSMDDALNNLRREAPSDLIIFGASEGFELAQFDARWKGRGAFTHALIEAIEESKAADKDGRITILSLFQYLQDRVPLMTDQAQHPTITPPLKDISDFMVAKK